MAILPTLHPGRATGILKYIETEEKSFATNKKAHHTWWWAFSSLNKRSGELILADGVSGGACSTKRDLLVVPDRADLVVDLGDVGHLVNGFGLAGSWPLVVNLADLALLGGPVDLLAERLAGLVF